MLARIVSINDLIETGPGEYGIDISSGNRNASVKVHGSDEAKEWDLSFIFRLGTGFTFGTGRYPHPNQFLANIKVMRMWNQGSTKENLFVELDPVANEFKLQIENDRGEAAEIKYFGKPILEKLVLGIDHLLKFRYSENSAKGAADGRLKVSLDGVIVKEYTNLITRMNFAGLKRPHTLGFHSVWEAGSGGDKAPNNFVIREIRPEMVNVTGPEPIPPVVTPPDTKPPQLPGVPVPMPEWFKTFITDLAKALGTIVK